MHNKYLLNNVIFASVFVLFLGVMIALGMYQYQLSDQPVATTSVANFQDNDQAQIAGDAIVFRTEKLVAADQAQVELVYTAAQSQKLLGLSLKILVGEYRPPETTALPFVLSDQLKQAGVVDQINKWSCETKQVCTIDLALINPSPGGFELNPGQKLGLIRIVTPDQAQEFNLQLDPDQTQALTVGGESVTIEIN